MVRCFGRVSLVVAALLFTACPEKSEGDASQQKAAAPATAPAPGGGATISAAPTDAGAAPTTAGGMTAPEDAGAAAPAPTAAAPAGPEQYATFETTQGTIVVRLFPQDAPKTVENFVALAQGKKEWTDPRTNKVTSAPLYNGTIFHRVIPGFMIQGGDPMGVGMGGPGYQFEDEFQSGRSFDKPGILAMANRGPNTNGSQFFITTSTPQHLNNRHTIFGEVVEGYEVVEKIASVPTGPRNQPLQDVVIKQVTISSKRP